MLRAPSVELMFVSREIETQRSSMTYLRQHGKSVALKACERQTAAILALNKHWKKSLRSSWKKGNPKSIQNTV